MSRVKVYIQALRLPFLTGSLMPVFMAGAFALKSHTFSVVKFLLVLFGVGFVHLGSNVINDVYDAPGSDPINPYVTPFSGGSRVIQEELMSVGAMRRLAYVLFGLGVLCGLPLVVQRPLVLAVGAAGLLLGYIYSANPFGLMNRGLGEVVIFLAFGPVLSLGAYYVFTGELSLTGLALGLPLGLPITGVIWINQFPDYMADSEAKKRNLVVRMGTAGARFIHPLFMYGPFLAIALLVLKFDATGWLFLTIATLPVAHGAVKICFRFHADPNEIVASQDLTIKFHFLLGLSATLIMAIRYWPG
jgi:1,4-dihydroxy-2-naphthoate octaprenyltransferase